MNLLKKNTFLVEVAIGFTFCLSAFTQAALAQDLNQSTIAKRTVTSSNLEAPKELKPILKNKTHLNQITSKKKLIKNTFQNSVITNHSYFLPLKYNFGASRPLAEELSKALPSPQKEIWDLMNQHLEELFHEIKSLTQSDISAQPSKNQSLKQELETLHSFFDNHDSDRDNMKKDFSWILKNEKVLSILESYESGCYFVVALTAKKYLFEVLARIPLHEKPEEEAEIIGAYDQLLSLLASDKSKKVLDREKIKSNAQYKKHVFHCINDGSSGRFEELLMLAQDILDKGMPSLYPEDSQDLAFFLSALIDLLSTPDEPSGDEPSGDETSGDETSSNEISVDEMSQ